MTYQQIAAAFLIALGAALKNEPAIWLRRVEVSKVNQRYYRFEADSSGEEVTLNVPIHEFDLNTEEELDACMAGNVIPDIIRELLQAEEEPEDEDDTDEE